MVEVIKSSEKMSKADKCYIKACDILEDIIKKEKDSSLTFYTMGSIGLINNGYPGDWLSIHVTKEIFRNPVVQLKADNERLYNMAYEAAERIEKEHGFKVILEQTYE